MAIITPSAIISETRGKVGNQVFSRNQFRSFVKTFAVPANPNTSRQSSVRDAVRQANIAWQALSEAGRKEYYDNCIFWHSKTRLGVERPLSGFNYFVRQYVNEDIAPFGSMTPLARPRPLARLSMNAATCTTTVFTLQILAATTPAPYQYILRYTNAISPGIRSVNQNLYKLAFIGDLAAGDELLDLKAAWESRFATTLAAKAGKAIFLALDLQDPISGALFRKSWQKAII